MKAKRIIYSRLVSTGGYENAKKVMDDKRHHTLAQIEEAEEILARLKVVDNLPF